MVLLITQFKENAMALSSHIEQLKQKHVELEMQLEQVMKHPSAKDKEVAEIKRQKLLIKDKLNNLVH